MKWLDIEKIVYIEDKDLTGINVAFIIGSDSDKGRLENARVDGVCDGAGVTYCVSVISAHRNLRGAGTLEGYLDRITKLNPDVVFVCAAGMSAALPGVVAALAEDSLVIGVALSSSSPAGEYALPSMINLPKGVAVGITGMDEVGLYNAAVYGCKIVAKTDKRIAGMLKKYLKEEKAKKPSKWIIATNKNITTEKEKKGDGKWK